MLGLNKKGEDNTTWTIITVILIVLAFAGLFVWIGGGFKTFVGKSTDIEICRLSVLYKARYKVGEIQTIRADLNCPTNKLNILDKKDDKVSGEENIVAKNQDDVKRAIADEMFDCWYKFGNGEIDFVKGHSVPVDEETCFICSDIRFGKNLMSNTATGGEIKNFEDYLANTKVQGRDITYWEYFRGKLGEDKPVINLKLDEPQAVVFSVVKLGTWKRWFVTGAGSLGAAGIATLVYSGPPGWIVGGVGVATFFVIGTVYDIKKQEHVMSMTVVPLKDAVDCKGLGL